VDVTAKKNHFGSHKSQAVPDVVDY